MSTELAEKEISCPYCGEPVSLLIDASFEQQSYVEDCQVCCQPMQIDVVIGAGDELMVTARTDNET